MSTNNFESDQTWNQALKRAIDIIKKYNPYTDTFCVAPYTVLDFDQSGEMHSCYAGTSNLGDWKNESIVKEFNNDRYRSLRFYQQTGQRDKSYHNCKRCYNHEQMQNKSARQKELVNVFFKLGEEGFEDLVKKIVGNNYQGDITDNITTEMRSSNFCNLQCMHCDHISSTQWLNFYTDQKNLEIGSDIGLIDSNSLTVDNIANKFKKYRSSDVVKIEELQNAMSSAKILHFSGGEPLLDPNHEKWLQHLTRQKNCNTQEIWYHSNLNIKNIERFFMYWQKFKKVRVIVSVDCPPSTYKFFRRNGDFDLVKTNIDKIRNFFCVENVEVECRITFNFFAALRWQEITDYWISNDFVLHSSLVTHGPVAAEYIPNDLKQKSLHQMELDLDKVKNHSAYSLQKKQAYEQASFYCYNYLKNSNYHANLNKNTLKFLKMLDEKTSLSTLDFYPELERYYNKTND